MPIIDKSIKKPRKKEATELIEKFELLVNMCLPKKEDKTNPRMHEYLANDDDIIETFKQWYTLDERQERKLREMLPKLRKLNDVNKDAQKLSGENWEKANEMLKAAATAIYDALQDAGIKIMEFLESVYRNPPTPSPDVKARNTNRDSQEYPDAAGYSIIL